MSSQRAWTMAERVGVTGQEMPAVALETRPGDLLMFNQDLKHASFGGGTRRRMFTINVSERFAAEDLDELRQDIGHGAPILDRARLRPRHDPNGRATAHASPGTAPGE